MADLSRVRNAVRDVAEAMARFDRDYQRMQREMKRALEDGASEREVTAIANQALSGHPDLQERFRQFIAQLEERQAEVAR